MKPLKIKGCDVVRFSPDGTGLAGFARYVGIWDLASRKMRKRFIVGPASREGF
jgi:hypothetical protein